MKRIFYFLFALFTLSACDGIPGTGHHEITLNEFHNRIDGNLGDYPVVIPNGFELIDSNQSAFKRFVWGLPGAIDDEGRINDCIIEVAYSRDVTWMREGYFGNARQRLDEATLAEQGVQNARCILGAFRGLGLVPALAISGELEGKPLRLAYIYSPYRDAAFAITVKGGDPADIDEHWQALVEGFRL